MDKESKIEIMVNMDASPRFLAPTGTTRVSLGRVRRIGTMSRGTRTATSRPGASVTNLHCAKVVTAPWAITIESGQPY